MKTPESELPDAARREGRGGRCAFSLVVDVQGEPQNVRLIRCTDPIFAPNATKAVKGYRFKPASTIQDSKPIPVTINIEVTFSFGLPDRQNFVPPARVRAEFVMPIDAIPADPDKDGIFTLSSGFGTPESFPRIKKFPDQSFAGAAFGFDDGVGCTLALTINQSGKPYGVKVVKCDRLGLERSAVESLSKAKFSPAILNGKAVPVHAIVHLVCDGFELPSQTAQ